MDHSLASQSTPHLRRHDSSDLGYYSSIFLTPPMSQERHLVKNNSEIWSPFTQPNFEPSEDFLTYSYQKGYPILTQKILSNLSPEDIYSYVAATCAYCDSAFLVILVLARVCINSLLFTFQCLASVQILEEYYHGFIYHNEETSAV